jgi:hypothetical protein
VGNSTPVGEYPKHVNSKSVNQNNSIILDLRNYDKARLKVKPTIVLALEKPVGRKSIGQNP